MGSEFEDIEEMVGEKGIKAFYGRVNRFIERHLVLFLFVALMVVAGLHSNPKVTEVQEVKVVKAVEVEKANFSINLEAMQITKVKLVTLQDENKNPTGKRFYTWYKSVEDNTTTFITFKEDIEDFKHESNKVQYEKYLTGEQAKEFEKEFKAKEK